MTLRCDWTVWCDGSGCPMWIGEHFVTRKIATEAVKSFHNGWYRKGNKDYCPECGKIFLEEMLDKSLGIRTEKFVEGIGTVRRCLDCNRPVVGGPTRCIKCAKDV